MYVFILVYASKIPARIFAKRYHDVITGYEHIDISLIHLGDLAETTSFAIASSSAFS
jgi:hypothetical protein